jgi:hypothetical protein
VFVWLCIVFKRLRHLCQSLTLLNNSVIPGFHHTLYDGEPLCWGCSEGGERKRVGVAIYEVLLKPFPPQGTCRPEFYTCGMWCCVVYLFIIYFFFNLRTAAFKAYCAIWVRRSNFLHQASPCASPRESTQWQRVELWARNVWEFCLNVDFHVTFRDLLHAVKLRRLYFSYEGRHAEDFFAL